MRSSRCIGWSLLLALGLQPSQAAAQDLPELPAGLSPEEAAIEPKTPTVPLGVELQLWFQLIHEQAVDDLQTVTLTRFVTDFRREWKLAPGVRFTLSERLQAALDLPRPEGVATRTSALSNLRELWIDWQVSDGATPVYLGFGRTNVRNGVGSGYNPTDFFKRGAVRQPLSLDPGAWRVDRLGTFMVMLQCLGADGSFSLAAIPPLSTQDPLADLPWYSLALNRTNRHASFYGKWAPRLDERVSLDVLLFQRADELPQLGTNLTWLLGSAWVLHAENALGLCKPLIGPGDTPSTHAVCERLSAGFTWTTPLGIEITLEEHFASDALSKGDWQRWRTGSREPTPQGLELRRMRGFQLEPLVRFNAFARLSYRDAFNVRGLHLAAFVALNELDWSGLTQLSATWNVNDDWSLSALGSGMFGAPDSEYGESTARLQAALYFSLYL